MTGVEVSIWEEEEEVYCMWVSVYGDWCGGEHLGGGGVLYVGECLG